MCWMEIQISVLRYAIQWKFSWIIQLNFAWILAPRIHLVLWAKLRILEVVPEIRKLVATLARWSRKNSDFRRWKLELWSACTSCLYRRMHDIFSQGSSRDMWFLHFTTNPCFSPVNGGKNFFYTWKRGVLAPACCRGEPCPGGGGSWPRQKSRGILAFAQKGPVPSVTAVTFVSRTSSGSPNSSVLAVTAVSYGLHTLGVPPI